MLPCAKTPLALQELCTLPELRANPFRVRMCELFSENGCGQLTFHQFINMMGIFSQRASLEVKIIWAFSIWDFDGAITLEAIYTESCRTTAH